MIAAKWKPSQEFWINTKKSLGEKCEIIKLIDNWDSLSNPQK